MKDIVRAKNLTCFKEVSEVIGEAGAVIELCKVLANTEVDTSTVLDCAFVWSVTPQGQHFWDCIDDGVLPESYRNAMPTNKDKNHYADMLCNYIQTISQAGGDVDIFIDNMDTMTVKEMLVSLAPSGVRFTYNK